MKKTKTISILSLAGILVMFFMHSCKVPESIAMKSGAQLWAENCNRCHNAPDPKMYGDNSWDVACDHMKQKALLTDAETIKIRDFLKSAN
jgi:hypothetical protein